MHWIPWLPSHLSREARSHFELLKMQSIASDEKRKHKMKEVQGKMIIRKFLSFSHYKDSELKSNDYQLITNIMINIKVT